MAETFQVINEVANSQFVWAICCIGLGYYVIKKFVQWKDTNENNLLKIQSEYREESRERESRLMEHLDKTNATQKETVVALESINKSLDVLDIRIVELEKRN